MRSFFIFSYLSQFRRNLKIKYFFVLRLKHFREFNIFNQLCKHLLKIKTYNFHTNLTLNQLILLQFLL